MKNLILFFTLSLFLNACTDDFYLELDPLNQGEIFDARSGEKGALTLYRVLENKLEKIGDYDVPRRFEGYQEDSQSHEELWRKVVSTIPASFRSKIVEFEVFVGSGSLDGYVHPVNDSDLSKWRLALAVDLEEYEEESRLEEYMTYLILHEFGHIVTLNDEQVDVSRDFSNCQEYALDEGCSLKNSYINKIFEIGWADIIDEVNFEDQERTYRLFPSRFHSEYAATNVAEDAAEVFARFILDADKLSRTSIADRKLEILYGSTELLRMRKEIRKEIEPALILKLSNSLGGLKLRGHRVCKHNHAHFQ